MDGREGNTDKETKDKGNDGPHPLTGSGGSILSIHSPGSEEDSSTIHTEHSDSRLKLIRKGQVNKVKNEESKGGKVVSHRRVFTVDKVPNFVLQMQEGGEGSAEGVSASTAVEEGSSARLLGAGENEGVSTEHVQVESVKRTGILKNDGRNRNSGLFVEPSQLDYEVSAYGSYREALAKEVCSRVKNTQSVYFPWQEDMAMAQDTHMGAHGPVLKRGSGRKSHGDQDGTLKEKVTGYRAGSMIFLAILGIVAASVSAGQDQSVYYLTVWKNKFADSQSSFAIQYITYIGFSACVLCTAYISPMAAGSGIPEMKTILSGVELKGFLRFRTLFAKVFGLIGVLSAGLSVGKEGPFVHTSSIIAEQMFKVPFFRHLGQSRAMRHQILSAACAVGVASTFGAPVGGVLFSIEVTSVYYLISSYWKASFCAICGAFVVSLYYPSRFFVFETNFTIDHYNVQEYVLFIILGLIGGVFGALMIKLSEFFIYIRRRFLRFLANTKYVFEKGFDYHYDSKNKEKHEKHTQYLYIFNKFRVRFNHVALLSNPYIFAMFVGVLTAVCFFPFGEFMRRNSRESVRDLFSDRSLRTVGNATLDDELNCDDWYIYGNSIYPALAIYVGLRYLFTALSITLMIPAGVYTPLFAIGAGTGRMIGEFANSTLYLDLDIHPGGVAVIGASAFGAGVTRTISTAVIMFEVTGQLKFMLPILVAVVVAIAVGNRISKSIYDSIMVCKKLPYLPAMSFDKAMLHTARDIMIDDLDFLERKMSYGKLAVLLRDKSSEHDSYPIVDSKDNMFLLGVVNHDELVALMEKYYQEKGFEMRSENTPEHGCTELASCATTIALAIGIAVPHKDYHNEGHSKAPSRRSSGRKMRRTSSHTSVSQISRAESAPISLNMLSTPARVEPRRSVDVINMPETRLDDFDDEVVNHNYKSRAPRRGYRHRRKPQLDYVMQDDDSSDSDGGIEMRPVVNIILPEDEPSPSSREHASTQSTTDSLFNRTTDSRRSRASSTNSTSMALVEKHHQYHITRSHNALFYHLPEEVVTLMDDEVDLVECADLHVDTAPYQVVESTPLSEVHFLFTMMRFPYVFVTRFGSLCGVITQNTLVASLADELL
eukprot:Nk52_evm4s167 gene=Nk52_evmTU4s167